MKTVKVLSFAIVVVGCLATGRSLFAHHGDAAYSAEAIELKGAVVTAMSIALAAIYLWLRYFVLG